MISPAGALDSLFIIVVCKALDGAGQLLHKSTLITVVQIKKEVHFGYIMHLILCSQLLNCLRDIFCLC